MGERPRRSRRAEGAEVSNQTLAPDASPALAPAVFVTGMIRSGTTWLGRVLATARDTLYIHEPFNPDSPWNAAVATPSAYLYLCATNGGPWRGRIGKLLRLTPNFRRDWTDQARKQCLRQIKRARAHATDGTVRPLIKDPTAFFSTEWLVETFAIRPVFVLRHPVMVAKSLLRLGWVPPGIQINFWRSQPLLRQRFYADYADDLARAAEDARLSPAERACWYVRLAMLAQLVYYRDHPEWRFVSYEALLADAPAAFPGLMQHLGLHPTKQTEKTITGTGVYDPKKAHQATQKPIPLDRQTIWAPNSFHDDWRALYDRFFRDLEEGFSDVVVWSE